MVLFHIFSKMSQKWSPDKEGESPISCSFLTWMHFGRQGLAMELPGDFQEHFYMILTKFGNNFGRESSEMTEKEEQWMTTPSTMRQVGTHWRKQNNAALARWRAWAQPFG